MKRLRVAASLLLLPLFFVGCDAAAPGSPPASIPATTDTARHDAPVHVEAKTFAVTDSMGAQAGWGYDLYVNGKKTIHQPIIPGVPGNNAFPSEEQARKTGEYAASKMERSGTFPSLSVKELDSLGITHN
ncbi:MAG TPA: DUF4907 domain-containing protein [Bacteroidia bacterium]|nr:DUF4907 domain-containing protein [Bacteroidia bacterium]